MDISDAYPEKVLATTERFYAYRPDEYIRMIEVLQRACEFCGAQENQSELLKILSKSQYLNCTPKTLAHALSGRFPMGFGNVFDRPFMRFSGEVTNRPDVTRAEYILNDICRYLPSAKAVSSSRAFLKSVYREDLYDQAICPVASY